MIHLTSCHNATPIASDSEIRELSRRLERGDVKRGTHDVNNGVVPVSVKFGSREAAIVVDALRRCV